MRKSIAIIMVSFISISFTQCKWLAKSAARHWTKKQIKEFRANCENSALGKLGEAKGKDFCSCAVDVVMEEVHDYNEAKELSFIKIASMAKDCVQKSNE